MSVSWEKVRLVGQFEILAQDNLFSSKVRLVGQLFLRSCPTGRTLVYSIDNKSKKKVINFHSQGIFKVKSNSR